LSSREYLQSGRYVTLKKLGEGEKGVTYKARDTALNRVVAIKMLKSAVLSEEAHSSFIREAQVVAKLNHPNIVSIYDIGKEDGGQFFVLEFVDGMSLRELIRTYPEGKCDIQTVLRVGIDVCSALQYAHSQGVLHRDVKPENILIAQEGTAKLMDFSLAKMLGQPNITQEGTIVGTVAYVAPEIALGKGADARSDLYSFGAVLYEAVTGKPPFAREDPVKIIFSQIHDYPVSPSKLNPKVPQALAECIIKLLEKEPAKRYQTAADLLMVLRDIAEGYLRETLVPSHKPSVVVPSPRPISAKEVQLINRVEEMSLLRGAVDKAVRGEGGLVFLYGEAGIGKTRLTRELGAYARLRGMQVLYGRCPALFRMDGVPPYVLWSEVIKDYLEGCSPEQLYRVIGFYPSEVSKLVPELRQRLGAIPQSFPIGPEQERDRLFEAISQFITNISKEAPLLLVLDDLQWTDQTSLLLMHYLARGIYKTPLLLLGAYRDTDIDERHPLSPVLTELNRERLLQSVQLKRMSLNDVSEMIKQLLEQEDVSKEFGELVYEKTRGNPFFVEEVIKSLKEEEVIYREENRWKFKEVSKIEFPKTVKSVIKARISRLDEDCQNILTLASFVGNDFSFDAICGVTNIEENKLLELMEKLLKTGLIKERVIRAKDMYCFADIIVRDVVHEEVSHLRHKKLHSVVGSTLEKVYAKEIDQHFGELAYHFLEGGDQDKALDYFLKAGEKAQKVYAYLEAFSYLQHALKFLEEKGDNLEQKAGIMERLGDLKAWIGETDAGMEYWDKSLTLWNQLRDKKSISRLHVKMAQTLWDVAGDKEKASEHHRMALEILEKEAESVELASLYEDISHMLWRTGGESAKALSFTQKAFELAEKLGDPEILAECYNDLGILSLHSGEIEKSIRYCEQGLKIALENNRIRPAIRLYNNLSGGYESIGDLQKAFEMRREGFELAKKVGETRLMAWVGLVLAYSYWMMGEIQKSFSMIEELLALNKRTKNTICIAQTMGAFGFAYQLLGEWDKSLKYLMEARDIIEKVGEYQFSGAIAFWLGQLFMEMEDYVEAEKYFKEGNDIYEKAGDTDAQLAGAFPALSRLYLKKSEIEKARKLIEKTYEYVTKTKNRVSVVDAEKLKGMLFREEKNWQQSMQHFEKSLQESKSLNLHKWYVQEFAELLYEYGLMYLEKNEEGDKEKAYSLLNQALDIYERVDAKKRIEKVKSKLIYARTGQQATKPEPTATEVSAVVPPNRTSIGYKNLDDLLSGGIPQNYAALLTSLPCDERDLLIKRFLETGAKNGEVVFYITIDPGESKSLAEEFQSDFFLFVCNPQADTIVKSLPNVFKLKGVENLTEINIALTSAFNKLDEKPRRACIGILSDVLLQHHAVQTRRWLTSLIPELRSKGFTTLAVMDPGMHSSQEVRAILDLFEGEINIYEKETEKGLEKFLKIKKMANQRYSESELPLRKEKWTSEF
jgi:tetratricopeptide (TPR) repeat protein